MCLYLCVCTYVYAYVRIHENTRMCMFIQVMSFRIFFSHFFHACTGLFFSKKSCLTGQISITYSSLRESTYMKGT